MREALAKVPEGNWKEFSAFAGPRLETLTAWDKVVLIGDASHPLSGNSFITLSNLSKTTANAKKVLSAPEQPLP